jgi:hypothetical protein
MRVTAYPASSGTNDPEQMWDQKTGPLPDVFLDDVDGDGSYEERDWYLWGAMNDLATGFEFDTDESFYPGKWRLDPWTILNPTEVGDPARSSFEIHGGVLKGHDGNVVTSRLWNTGTLGCIRLDTEGVLGLKSKWDNRTTNQDSARLYVRYGDV